MKWNKILKKYLGVVYLLAVSQNCLAIVNIEDGNWQLSKDGSSVKLFASVAGSSGNTEKQAFSVGGRWQVKKDQVSAFIIADSEYGETSGTTNTNKKFLHGRYITRLNADFAWELFAQAETDEFRRLESRWLVGGGGRWFLADEEQHQNYLGLGTFYSTEKINFSDINFSGNDDSGTVKQTRLNAYWVFRSKVSERVTLLNTIYWQPSFKDTSDYRALNQFSLSIDIAEKLQWKWQVNASYDSLPPMDVKKKDVSYSSVIEWQF